jgi:two-component system response regulator DesR
VQVLIVDPNTVSRIGFAVLFRRQPWVARCLLATDRNHGVLLAQRHRPDVAIVEASSAGPFIAAELASLRRAHPAMTIVLGPRSRSALPVPAASVGAAGEIALSSGVEEIIATVRNALVGESQPVLLQHRRFDAPARTSTQLSDRERQVLALLTTGATNREIAAAMNVGTETVKKHAHALFRKLGVRNRTEAAQLAAGLLAA